MAGVAGRFLDPVQRDVAQIGHLVGALAVVPAHGRGRQRGRGQDGVGAVDLVAVESDTTSGAGWS
jgi:hypothetical protein